MKKLTLLFMVATLCSTAFAQKKVARNIFASRSSLDMELIQDASQLVQLNRVLFAGYNTLCLPMSLGADQLQEAARDVQVERLAAVRQEGSTLNLYFLDCTADGIEAGVPYLIYSPTTQYLRARTADAIAVSDRLMPVTLSDMQGNRVTFTSSWTEFNGDGRYGIPAKQDTDVLQSILECTRPDQRFLPTRCGFIWEQQSALATELKIKHVVSLADIQTDIQQLKGEDAIVDVYDTAGTLIRRQVRINEALSTLPRGVYVIGGEKVLVK